MKKIVFTVTSDLNFDQRMDRICQVLADNGFDVLLIGRKKKISLPLKDKAYRQQRINCLFEKGKLFYLEYNIRLFFKLLFTSFDILCVIDLDTMIPGFFISKIKNKPVVYDAHEYFPEMIEVVRRPAVKKVWETVERLFVPRFKYAYTVNESIRKIFEDKYKVPFEVIRNVPVYEEFQVPEKKEKYIVYAGVVNEGRGLEELIYAMKLLDCKLVICGHGDIYDELIELVNEQQLQSKVKFYGYVQPEDLKLVIRQAYIGYLVLKESGLSYYYSLANKFFDYIHAGIPQITINFPEYRRVNEQYHLAKLVNLDLKDIIEAANSFLENDELYREYSENALKASKELNWQLESQKLVAFYKKIN